MHIGSPRRRNLPWIQSSDSLLKRHSHWKPINSGQHLPPLAVARSKSIMGGAQTKEADGSVVLVTGCSDGGIGSSLAMKFAEAGCLVVASARSLNSMAQLEKYPGIQTMVLDITNFEAVKAIVQSIEQEYGRIDILVNNAGVPLFAPVAEVPLTALETTYRTNVFGTVSLIQAVIPTMIAKGKGKIVNVGSITSYSYGPWSAGYASTKAAIHCLTDALRLELKPFGIHVMLVLPGAVKSNISKNSDVSMFDDLKFYQSWKSTLIRRVNLSQTAHNTPREEFAQKTVEKVLLRNPPPHFAYGRFTTIFTIMSYLPLWLTDKLYRRFMDLDRKAPRVEL